MRQPIALGESEFRHLRGAGALYVDKTSQIAELLADPSPVSLFLRPRRFGKTLWLTTLRAFLQRADHLGADTQALFEDLAIWQTPARALHQRFPVVMLSFKDVKGATWPEMYENLQLLLAETVGVFLDPPLHPDLVNADAGRLMAIYRADASPSVLQRALRTLTTALHRVTGQRVVLLIDEYDTPLHTAWSRGYYEEAIGFFRGMLAPVLKDNPALERAILTGILRVARESLFSGLNNLEVYSTLSPQYPDAFGFREEDVAHMLATVGRSEELDDVRAWYDGYLFGGVRIYNPWSLLSYLKKPMEGLRPYWVNTGGTELIEVLLQRMDDATHAAMQELMSGGTVVRPVEESLVFTNPGERSAALWSLLLAAGYLKPVAGERPEEEVELAIPNREVKFSWNVMFSRWMEQHIGASPAVHALVHALLHADAPRVQAQLQEAVLRSLSSHDLAGDRPERVWQAFVMGLLVHMAPTHLVHSNQESGLGRADVLIVPRRAGAPGTVMELKRLDEGEDPHKALDAALEQVRTKDYEAALRKAGASTIARLACVFVGKRVWVKAG